MQRKEIRIGEENSPTKYRIIEESTMKSGIEHIEEEIKMEQERITKSDASFYEKCNSYVSKMYPEGTDSSDFYSGIAGSLRYPIINKNPGFNIERFNKLIKHFFLTIAYGDYQDYTEVERNDRLTLEVAGIYIVCIENEDISKFLAEQQISDFKDEIQICLIEVIDNQLAEKVFDILNNN